MSTASNCYSQWAVGGSIGIYLWTGTFQKKKRQDGLDSGFLESEDQKQNGLVESVHIGPRFTGKVRSVPSSGRGLIPATHR